MTKKIDSVGQGTSVPIQTLIHEFVRSKEMILAVEKLTSKAHSKLALVKSFEEISLVLTEQEELTPEQTSLLQINANVAASVSSGDADNYYSEEPTTESYKELANITTKNVAYDLVDTWDKVRNALDAVIVLADSGLSDIDNVLTGMIEFKQNDMVSCLDSVAFTVESNILKLVPKESKDYFTELTTVRESLSKKIKHTNYSVCGGVEEILTQGIKKFSSVSVSTAVENLNVTKDKLTKLRNYATEESTVSADGLITDVVLTDGYVITNKDDKFSIDKTGAPTEQFVFKATIDEALVDRVIAETRANRELMLGVAAIAESLCADKLRSAIALFAFKSKGLFTGKTTDAKIRQQVAEHCSLVCMTIEAVNKEIKLMHYTARFSLAYNAFLINIISNAYIPTGEEL